MRVLAVDPGERVGWAVGNCILDTGTTPDTRLEVEDHGIHFLKDFALAADLAIRNGKYDYVVVEPFRIRPEKAKSFIGNDMPTIQLIGMLRLACWVSGTPYVESPPSNKTTARMSLRHGGDDIAARLAKLPKSHDDAHDGDALLHLWNFYFERYR